jgi:hypothetical protein
MDRSTDTAAELAELRGAFQAVPGPTADALWQARNQVRVQARPMYSLPRRPSHRLIAAGGLAGAVAVAALTAVVVSSSTPGTAGGPAAASAGVAAPAPATMTLAALRSTVTSAMSSNHSITYSTQTFATKTGTETVRMWQADLDRGPAWRVQSLDKSGRVLDDHATRPSSKPKEQQQIEYIGVVNEYAEWNFTPKPVPNKPAPPTTQPKAPVSAKDWFQTNLADGNLTLVGPTTLNGKAAILVKSTEGAKSDTYFKTSQMWIDAKTYLPLRDAVTMSGDTTVIDYSYLADNAANRAQLWITPKSSWKKVSSANLPRNLVS